MQAAHALKQKVFGASDTEGRSPKLSSQQAPAESKTLDQAQEEKKKKLREAFYGSTAQVPDKQPISSTSSSTAGGDPKASHKSVRRISSVLLANDTTDTRAPRFSPTPPLSVGPQMQEYDRLALLLHASLEKKKNRRRYHEYAETFYGKHAVDWLVGTQVFPDANDARNALRHLINRRLIMRADHTKPIFNDAIERIAPKYAQARKNDLLNRYASPARGFDDNHLYRFPPEAYSKVQLNVKIARARQLRYKSRFHLGSFAVYAKFRDRRIDPYCLLEFGAQTAKTDTWSDSKDDPMWESEFIFPVETDTFSGETTMKDLWIRVYDFHEVLDDLELGFVLLPSADILKNCHSGTKWVAWHALKPASELTSNDRTFGEVELVVSITPFVAGHPSWTVHKEARPAEGAKLRDFDAEEGDSPNFFAETFDKFGNLVNIMGGKLVDTAGNIIEEPGSPEKSADEEPQDQAKRFQLQIFKCSIGQNVADMKRDSPVWVEYTINSIDGEQTAVQLRGKSELKTWPIKDLGLSTIRGISLEDVQNASAVSVVIKIYSKTTGLTIKIGEASVPLSEFMPTFDTPDTNISPDGDVDWKTQAKTERVILRRTAAFRRNRKRIVGEVYLRAVVSPDSAKESDEDAMGFQDELDIGQGAKVIEEDLSNVVSLLSESGFVAPPALPHLAMQETLPDCTSDALFWYILSRNSPLLNLYAAKRAYKDLNLGDWKWGGRDRKSSYAGDEVDEKGLKNDPFSTAEPPAAAANAEQVSQRPNEGNTAGASPTNASVPFIRQESLSKLESAAPNGSLPKIAETTSGTPIEFVEKVLVDTPTSQSVGALRQSTISEVVQTTRPVAGKHSLESLRDGRSAQSEGAEMKQEEPITPKTLKPAATGQESSSGEECPSRVVTYKRPPEFPVKELNVKEIWRLKGFGADKGFCLEIEGTTDEPTYGKQMSMVVQIVVTSESARSCKLSISCNINWLSRPMAAGFVERSAIPATVNGYKQYVAMLRAAMGKKKGQVGGEEAIGEESVTAEAKAGVSRRRVILSALLSFLFALLLAYLAYIAYITKDFDLPKLASDAFPFLFEGWNE